MRQGESPINGPHQGGLVDTVNGEEWFVHFQDRGLYGRITHLQPVVWENDWPVIGINQKDGCGEPCLVHATPTTGMVDEALRPVCQGITKKQDLVKECEGEIECLKKEH